MAKSTKYLELEAYYSQKKKSDKRFNDPGWRRLSNEHLKLEEECSNDGLPYKVSYKVISDSSMPAPDKYLVIYDEVISITGINQNQEPSYGTHHEIEISLPLEYPLVAAKCYMQTPIWHPNIKTDGPTKGRICGNTNEFGRNYSIGDLILRIGDILQFHNYLAEMVPPYPEDEKVAKWVREFGEPNGFMNPDKGLLRIPEGLLKQKLSIENEAEPEQEQRTKRITIKKMETPPGGEPTPPKIGGITIKRKE